MSVNSCGGDLACSKYDGGYPVPIVTYDAAPGEANRVTVSRAGDTITAGRSGRHGHGGGAVPHGRRAPAHMSRAQRRAWPQPTLFEIFDVRLGDGADTLAITGSLGAATTLDAGDGDDVLTGGPDADILVGGLGADRLDGGAGADLLSFAARTDDVMVVVPARRTSDGDTFKGIESIAGGEGDDRLLGGSRADEFSGAGAPTSCAAAVAATRSPGTWGRTDRRRVGRGLDHRRSSAGRRLLHEDPQALARCSARRAGQ